MAAVIFTILMVLPIIIGLSVVAGTTALLKKRRGYQEKHAFAIEFMNKFGEYGNAYIHCKALDNQTYYWLVKNMDVMQHDLGLFGKIEYVPFMTNTLWHDYPIVLNTVQNFGNQTTRDTDCQMVHTAVVRYLGYLERCLDGQLFTPSAILRVGFMRVLSFPIGILGWFGILKPPSVQKVVQSVLFKILAAIVFLVGLAASIVTIIQGYDQTVASFKKVFGV